MNRLKRPEQRPPIADRREHTDVRHGASIPDPYHWLRDREDPAVIAYLEAENAYADAVMQPTEALQQRLYDEMPLRVEYRLTELGQGVLPLVRGLKLWVEEHFHQIEANQQAFDDRVQGSGAP